MAWIYRYRFRSKKLRNKYRVSDYYATITEVLKEYFKENLKFYEIRDEFFEFRLFISADNNTLRQIGKKFVKCDNSYDDKRNIAAIALKKIMEEEKLSGLFSRVSQELYGMLLVERSMYESKIVCRVELLDKYDIDEYRQTIYRGTAFIQSETSKTILYSKLQEDILIEEEMAGGLFAEVYQMEFEEYSTLYQRMKIKKTCKENEYLYFIVKGLHQRRKNNYNVEMYCCPESQIISPLNDNILNRELFERSRNFIKITSLELLSSSERKINISAKKKMKQKIDRFLKGLDSITYKPNNKLLDNKNCYKKIDNMQIEIHNVGQGLATSFAKNGNIPFLYFDYGLAQGRNRDTMPKYVYLPVNKDTEIVLSHVHVDHYYGYCINADSMQCKWYIPENSKINPTWNKIQNDILANGGNVSTISNATTLGKDNIYIGNTSRSSLTGLKCNPKCAHETGIACLVNLSKERNLTLDTGVQVKWKRLLIAGDQRYDFIPMNYMNNIDILVASHHGGSYSNMKLAGAFNCLPYPSSTKNPLIIYSYGMNKLGTNSYKHPSYDSDYKRKGWNNRWDTHNGSTVL